MPITQATDGTSLSYHDGGGTGTAVILVHGITESTDSWLPIIERLHGDHRVITMDLRGHGKSGKAPTYDLASMAGDVVAVATAAGAEQPHLVGHSLGGIVVSAVGAAMPVSSVVNVDQSLQLSDFKAGLMPVEGMLKDPATFGSVITGVFQEMVGDLLPTEEAARINANRRADQEVVLGVWDLLFTMSPEEIAAVVDEALAGYGGLDVPYLSLFGIDPGDGYADWLASKITGAQTELWPDHGHYPHLVNPDLFVERLNTFWASI